MRRVTSSVLIGLGTFLIIIAIMTRFYTYDKVAVIPETYNSTTDLTATDAMIFDAQDLKAVEKDLYISSYTYTNPVGNPPDGYTAWVNATTIRKDSEDGPIFQQSTDYSVFDNKTGEAAPEDKCGDCQSSFDKTTIVDQAYEVEQEDITRTGYIYKAPFNTPKEDMQWWDSAIEKATTMKYEGEEEIGGLNTYKFVQTIEPTQIGTQKLPKSVFDTPEDITADMMYSMVRTLWIEPVTGSPVKRIEARNQVFSYDGETIPAFVGDVVYTDDQVQELVDQGKTQSFLLGGMRLLFPLVLVILGIIAIVGGFLLRRPKKTGDQTPKANHKDLVTA